MSIFRLWAFSSVLALGSALFGQTEPASELPPAPPVPEAAPRPVVPRPAPVAPTVPNFEEEEEETITLALLTVTANNSTYEASNSTTGTVLALPIKEIPFNAEVLTRKFLEDIGANDLRESLKFTAGLETSILNAQPGENVSQETAFRLRGFVSEFALRNGFGRIGQTDTFNISQVDVLRGPAALLYGIGNFGGVVNYVTDRPSFDELKVTTEFGIGEWNYRRGRLSVANPVNVKRVLRTNLNLFWQEEESAVDYFERTRVGFSPVIAITPFGERTDILIEFEYLKRDETTPENPLGASFANSNSNSTYFSNEVMPSTLVLPLGALTAGSPNPRGLLQYPYQEFRYTGPDTSRMQEDVGFLFQLKQILTDDLIFSGGYYFSENTIETQSANPAVTNVNGVLSGSPDGQRLLATYPWLANPVDPNFDRWSTRNPTSGELDFLAIGYNWTKSISTQRRDQFRAELTYQFEIFKAKNFLTLGGTFNEIRFGARDFVLKDTLRPQTSTNNGSDVTGFQDAYTRFQSVRNLDPIRLDVADTEVFLQRAPDMKSRFFERGYYLLHQARFFNEKVRTVAGLRYDWVAIKVPGQRDPQTGEFLNEAYRPGGPATNWSPSLGINWELRPEIAVYVVSASAVMPIYRQVLADGLVPPPSTGQSYELGIKFDLFDQRLSGTMAIYHLEREGVVSGRAISAIGYPNASTDPIWLGQGRGGSSTTNAFSDDQSRGVDLQLQARDVLVPGLEPVFNFSYNDYQLKKVYAPSYNAAASNPGQGQYVFDTVQGQINEDIRNNDTPEYTVRLWTKYTFGTTFSNEQRRDKGAMGWLKGLYVGVGYSWTDEREASYGSNDPASFQFIPATGIWDALIGYNYRWRGISLALNLNVSNLENDTHAIGYSGYREGRRWRLSGNLRF